MFRALRARLVLCALAVSALASAGPHSLDTAHAPLERLLQRNVRYESHYLTNLPYYRTLANYAQLKGNREWDEYIGELPYVSTSAVKSAPVDARKAFWINTYNAMVMDAVAKNYPLRPAAGVTDFPSDSFRGNVNAWNSPIYVAGGTYSFQTIENMITDFDDPRAILALCSAAHGSPALPRTQYTATDVEFQLDDAARNFCLDPVNVRLDRTKNTLALSDLFRRHADLFRFRRDDAPAAYVALPPDQRAALGFIWKYLSTDAKDYISARKPRIAYMPFNWELNDVE